MGTETGNEAKIGVKNGAFVGKLEKIGASEWEQRGISPWTANFIKCKIHQPWQFPLIADLTHKIEGFAVYTPS